LNLLLAGKTNNVNQAANQAKHQVIEIIEDEPVVNDTIEENDEELEELDDEDEEEKEVGNSAEW
jgi:hypothetical protein